MKLYTPISPNEPRNRRGFYFAQRKAADVATGYLLVDHPNTRQPQGGYPRRGVSRPSGTAIIHTSEGNWFNGVASLDNLVQTRAEHGCYHQACDWQDISRYFPWEWETWQDSETNPWAVGIAAACRAADWAIMPTDIREGYYRNMARMAADFVSYMDTEYGVTVPLRRISGAEARARVTGFAAHGDSGISRTDPGADFDWSYFFKCTAQLLGAVSPETPIVKPKPKPEPKEWYEMAIPTADLVKIYEAVWFGAPGADLIPRVLEKGGEWPATSLGALTDRIVRQQLSPLRNQVASQNAQIKSLVGAVAALSKGEPFDQTKLLAGIQASAAAGVKEAVDSIETTVTIKEG